MVFEEMKAEENAVNTLLSSLNSGKISHAYLFEGIEETLKRNAALKFAGTLCCQSQSFKPCGQCSSCKKIESDNHPDIKLFEGAASSIKIEDIRGIIKSIQMKPYLGNRAIYIVNNAEKMTVQAQNALLKTLEDPPEHAVIILLASNAESLLPTIKSRCQVLKFRHRETKKEEFLSFREEAIEMTGLFFTENTYNILKKADFLNERKDLTEQVLDFLAGWYRDVLIYQNMNNEKLLINKDKWLVVKEQSIELSFDKVTEIIKIIETAKINLRSNVNYSLNIEVMLINIENVVKNNKKM